MTSGQGENQPGGPYGPPQGWNAPPPPTPPYPGHVPAPYGPVGQGAPPPMERPLSVRGGLGAFLGWMVLSAVAQVVSLLNLDTIVDWTVANGGAETDPATGRAVAETIVRIGSVGALVFIAVYGLFVWFAWRGRNWARIVLWVLAGLGIVSGMFGLIAGSPLPFLSALGGFEMLLLIAAAVLLALTPSNEWFRFRGWQLATGQG